MSTPSDRTNDKRQYFQRNYVKALELITPNVYLSEDVNLSGTHLNPISDLINTHVLAANSFSSLGFEVSASPGVSSISSLAGLAPYFVKQNNLTEITPFLFEKSILKPLGKRWKDFTTSTSFQTYVSGTLLPSIICGSSAPFLAVGTASAFSDTASGTHEYLIDSLSWFYFLNTSGNHGGLTFDGSTYITRRFVDTLYQGKTLYLNDGIKGLEEYIWKNFNVCTTFSSLNVLPTDYVSSVDSSTTWTSGTQLLDRLTTLVDIAYSVAHVDVQDEQVKDAFDSYIDASLLLTDKESKGPFYKFLKALGFMLADVNSEANELSLIYDIENCPPERLPLLAELIGWKFFGHDPSRWRLQLRNAVEVYKKMGTKKAVQYAVDSVFASGVLNVENKIQEMWESYVPHLIMYSLATESQWFTSLKNFPIEKAAGEWGWSTYSSSSLETNLRIAVDEILLKLYEEYPDNFQEITGVYNYRGRDLPIPPFEEYKYYKDTATITASTGDSILARIQEYLEAYGVSRTFAGSVTSYIRAYTHSTEDLYVENAFLFFTSAVQYPSNRDAVIESIGASAVGRSRVDYLSLWSGKSSHVKVQFKATDYSFANDLGLDSSGAQGVVQASRILKEFLPAHTVGDVALFTSGADLHTVCGTRGMELYFDSRDTHASAGRVANPNIFTHTQQFDNSTVETPGTGYDAPYKGSPNATGRAWYYTTYDKAEVTGGNPPWMGDPSVIPNSAAAPDGTITADKLIFSSLGSPVSSVLGVQQYVGNIGHQGVHGLSRPVIKPNTPYVFSLYLKTDTLYSNETFTDLSGLRIKIQQQDITGKDIGKAPFNMQIRTDTGANPLTLTHANDWKRVEVSAMSTPNSDKGQSYMVARIISERPQYASGGKNGGPSGILVWGAQFEEGTTASPYRPVFGLQKETWSGDAFDLSGNRIAGSYFARQGASAVDMRGPYAPRFKREDVDQISDRLVSGLTLSSTTSSMQLPRSAVRRRSYKNLLDTNEYYDRTGFNMPLPLHEAASSVSHQKTANFMPLGYIPSAGRFQGAEDTNSLNAVWGDCVTLNSSDVYFGVAASDTFACRGVSGIMGNYKYADQPWTASTTNYYSWRGHLSPVIRVMHDILEKQKLLQANSVVYGAASSIYAASTSWMDMPQSYANSATLAGEWGPSSMEDWYGFGFGRDLHSLYKDYNGHFGKHNLRPDLMDSDGGRNMFSHLYGPLLWNGNFNVKGILQTNNPSVSSFVTSSFDPSDSVKLKFASGAGILSEIVDTSTGWPVVSGAYTASTILEGVIPGDGFTFSGSQLIGEFRNPDFLSGVELIMPSGAGIGGSGLSDENYFEIINIDSTRATKDMANLFVNNTGLKMRAVDGFPRIKFDLSKYGHEGKLINTGGTVPARYAVEGSGAFSRQANALIPDHEYTLNVKAFAGEDTGKTAGGASLGCLIRTAPVVTHLGDNASSVSVKGWIFNNESEWEIVDYQKLTMGDILDKYSHVYTFPSKEMPNTTIQDSEGNATLANLGADDLYTFSVPFNTINEGIVVPPEYYNAERSPNFLNGVIRENGGKSTGVIFSEDFTSWLGGADVSSNAKAPPTGYSCLNSSADFVWSHTIPTNNSSKVAGPDLCTSAINRDTFGDEITWTFSIFLSPGPGTAAGMFHASADGQGDHDTVQFGTDASGASATIVKISEQGTTNDISIQINWSPITSGGMPSFSTTYQNNWNPKNVYPAAVSLQKVDNDWYRAAITMTRPTNSFKDAGDELGPTTNHGLNPHVFPAGYINTAVNSGAASGGVFMWGAKLEARRPSWPIDYDVDAKSTDAWGWIRTGENTVFPGPYNRKEGGVHLDDQEYTVEVFMIPSIYNKDKFILLDGVSITDQTLLDKAKVEMYGVVRNRVDDRCPPNQEFIMSKEQINTVFQYFNKISNGIATRRMELSESLGFHSKGGSRINYRVHPRW